MRTNTWVDAERNAAAFLRVNGYPSARVTVSGADGGVDIRGGDVIGQVKRQSAPVGRAAVQCLAGAGLVEPGKARVFFTSVKGAGTYTALAVAYADAVHIGLFTYGSDGSVQAVNETARLLIGVGKKARQRQNRRRAEKYATQQVRKQQGYGGRG